MKLTIVIISLGLVSVTYTCNCGWMNKGRIVGGRTTGKNAYPFIAAIYDDRNFRYCGGTIITDWHVLTATHCTNRGRQHKIRVGVTDLKTDDGASHHIARVINHEEYSEELWINDISLIVTKTRIIFNQNVGPACMPTSPLSLTGEYVKILVASVSHRDQSQGNDHNGWGRLSDYGRSTHLLQEVDVSVISFSKCKAAMEDEEHHPLESIQLCTYREGKSSCQGDSGGPVVYFNTTTRRFTLAGIVSYGGICGGPDPHVSTNVGAYIPWIQQHIADVHGAALCSRE